MARIPIRSGAHAGALDWRPLSAAAEAALRPLLDATAAARIETVSEDPQAPRYLRTLDRQGRPQVFYKVVDAATATRLRRERALAQCLHHAGIATPVPIGEIVLQDGAIALGSHWTDGAHPVAGQVAFHPLGQAIARLHGALSAIAPDFAIAATTRERLQGLGRLAQASTFEAHWRHSPHAAFAGEMRDAFLELRELMVQPFAIHGDLNPGNILLTDDHVCFLDFEDALHGGLWPGLDLAKVAERLILPVIDAVGTEAAAAMFCALVDGYRAQAPLPPGPSIAEAMRWHAGLAVLVVTRDLHRWPQVADREMRKFHHLMTLADRHGRLFRIE